MGNETVSNSFNPQNNNNDNNNNNIKGGGGNSTLSFKEFYSYKTFYKSLPYYLAIGMSNDDFWNGNVSLTESYRKADDIKKRRMNEECWLQGAYVYSALISYAPLVIPFNKHPKPSPYLKKPISITKEMQEEEEKEKFYKILNEFKAIANIKEE